MELYYRWDTIDRSWDFTARPTSCLLLASCLPKQCEHVFHAPPDMPFPQTQHNLLYKHIFTWFLNCRHYVTTFFTLLLCFYCYGGLYPSSSKPTLTLPLFFVKHLVTAIRKVPKTQGMVLGQETEGGNKVALFFCPKQYHYSFYLHSLSWVDII